MTDAGGTVLLVEDSPGDEFLLVTELEQSPLVGRVDIARDGQQALDYLLDHGRELPRLVLMDLKLPRIDGHEVLTRLRAEERTRMLPVVVVSSSAEHRDVQLAYSSGANGYVRKPIRAEALSESIQRLLGFWLAVNETYA